MLILFVLLFQILFTTIVHGKDVIYFDNVTTVSVRGDDIFKVQLPNNLAPVGSTIPMTISISSNVRNTNSNARVNFVAIHGRNSETWTLAENQTRTITLCIEADGNLNSIIVITQIEGHDGTYWPRPIDVDFFVTKLDTELEFGPIGKAELVTEGSPVTFLINHSSRSDATLREHFVLNLVSNDTSNDVCAIVTVQNRECPLKNLLNNFETAEMYATMLTTATFTIKTSKFKFIEPFYVNIIVLPDNRFCSLEHYQSKTMVQVSSTNSSTPKPLRQKYVRLTIVKGPQYNAYVSPIAIALLSMGVVIILSTIVLLAKTYESNQAEHYAPEMSRMNTSPDLTQDRHVEARTNGQNCQAEQGDDDVDGLRNDDVAFQLSEKCRDVIRIRPKHRKIRIQKGLNRLREDASLKDMASILNEDIWFRRNRSRVYLYLIPIVSIFYFIPAIQFAFLAKLNEDKTGSLDLCFHNFRCALPFSIFSDFNHVISNMSYIIFGVAFIMLVYVKSIRLPDSHHPKNDHNTNKGIMQQLSIFYAMGLALVFQGLFSVCYHVCPTNLSLQFDTTMMYIICLLCYIKIYQFRHPDATPNAYSVFMFLGVLVLLEALALYFTSWWVFGPFLIFYIIMTIIIAFDCYYIGIGRLDRKVAWILAKDIVSNWKPVTNKRGFSCIRYPKRFLFALFFCFGNFAFAIYTMFSKRKNPNKNVSHVVLTILAGNMMFYLFYYVIRKNFKGCSKSCGRRNKTDSCCCSCRRSLHIGRLQIPIPISAGSFFSIFALFLGGIALNFYYDRTANRNLPPAESRNLNAECTVLEFYDGHDLWHFFSAAGIFMAFLALLTVDDDILGVPRNEIDVF